MRKIIGNSFSCYRNLSRNSTYFTRINPKDLQKEFKLEEFPAYSSSSVESNWYEWWEKNQFFNNKNAKEKFIMVLPPPNITGSLHIGHALTSTIQDILARWHRMQGKDVVWVPGCDHAGIATQGVVEKHIWNSQRITRHQLGRQKFVDEVWKWYGDKENVIYKQLKRIGMTLDWPRAVFTLDQHMSKAVLEAFLRLYKKGLIYKKDAIINWCPKLQSVISDIEVEHIEINGPTSLEVPGYENNITFGKIYTISYPLVGLDKTISVCTTRPETMLGDTAVMIHPDDKRYKHLHGKFVYHVFRDENIPIICDTSVDMNFGSGVVKVTPAHSAIDYLVSLKHDLSILNIISDDGIINSNGGIFKGQPRFVARENILKELKKLELYEGSKDHKMILPVCSRTQDVIEPMLKPQWFLKTKEMVNRAKEAVENGGIDLVPKYQNTIWLQWVKSDNVDWCISRQLWWGHRIPVFYVTFLNGHKYTIVAKSKEDARNEAIQHYGLKEQDILDISQDTDVLDTWFSSALFPFASLGWPNDNKDLEAYYPTSILVTGRDILFFWVIRMVMMAVELTQQLPFKDVFAHGLVFDSEGKKMSKSKGNVIDPISIISKINNQGKKENELYKEQTEETYERKCGADALRKTLCELDLKEEVLKFDLKKLENNSNFANKIWNTFRFYFIYHLKNDQNVLHAKLVSPQQKKDLSPMNQWILHRLSQTIKGVNDHFTTFDLNDATRLLHKFWYEDLCDVYLESVKPILQSDENNLDQHLTLSTLWTCLHEGLILFSPIMPFITEELYQYLPSTLPKQKSILQELYPKYTEWQWCTDETVDCDVNKCLSIAHSIRHLKSSYGLTKTNSLRSTVVSDDSNLLNSKKDWENIISTLSRTTSNLRPNDGSYVPTKRSIPINIDLTTIAYLDLEDSLDYENEVQRLEKRIVSLEIKEKKLAKYYKKKKLTKEYNTQKEELRGKIQGTKDLLQKFKEMI